MCAEGGEEGGWDGWEADIFEGAAVEGGAGLAFFFFFSLSFLHLEGVMTCKTVRRTYLVRA